MYSVDELNELMEYRLGRKIDEAELKMLQSIEASDPINIVLLLGLIGEAYQNGYNKNRSNRRSKQP